MNRNPIKLGVGIPTFVKSTSDLSRLTRLLESLASQTSIPDEVIVSDNSPIPFVGSVKGIVKDFKSLPIVYMTNSYRVGLAMNSNFILEHLNSSHVHLMHQDDFLINLDFYERIRHLLHTSDLPWILVGGATKGSLISPSLRKGKLPKEMLLGLNRVGGPGCSIFLRTSHPKYDERFSMMADVKLFFDAEFLLGAPLILTKPEIYYDLGDWQLQRNISELQFQNELDLLNTLFPKLVVSRVVRVFANRKRYDVKLRALNVLCKVSTSPIPKIMRVLFVNYLAFRIQIRLVLMQIFRTTIK